MRFLRWSVTFFLIALIAAFFGYGGIAIGAADVSKFLFFVFAVLSVLTFLADVTRSFWSDSDDSGDI